MESTFQPHLHKYMTTGLTLTKDNAPNGKIRTT